MALAHQLPRAVGSAFSLAAVPATALGQARASPHGQHCGGLVHQPAGRYTIAHTDALAHSWPRALRKYAFPPVSLIAQTLCKLREDGEQVLLVAPHWPTRT